MEYDEHGRIKVHMWITNRYPQPFVLGPKMVFRVQKGVAFTTDPGVAYRVLLDLKDALIVETFFSGHAE